MNGRYGPTGSGKTHTMSGLVNLAVDELYRRMEADCEQLFMLHAS